MILKRPLDLRRLRAVLPPGFGWLDHRLLRQGYFPRCSPPAWALYALLACASDARGLSFYSDARLGQLLRLEPAALRQARRELLDAGLIAFRAPLCQLLALEPDLEEEDHRAPAPLLPAGKAPARRICALPEERLRQLQSAAPAGLDLAAMVRASMQEGGVQ